MGLNIARGAQRHAATFQNHRSWELIGAQVSTCIENAGVTSVVLAERTGLSPNAIQNVKNGSQVPLMSVVRIARALGLPIDDLIPEGAL